MAAKSGSNKCFFWIPWIFVVLAKPSLVNCGSKYTLFCKKLSSGAARQLLNYKTLWVPKVQNELTTVPCMISRRIKTNLHSRQWQQSCCVHHAASSNDFESKLQEFLAFSIQESQSHKIRKIDPTIFHKPFLMKKWGYRQVFSLFSAQIILGNAKWFFIRRRQQLWLFGRAESSCDEVRWWSYVHSPQYTSVEIDTYTLCTLAQSCLIVSNAKPGAFAWC